MDVAETRQRRCRSAANPDIAIGINQVTNSEAQQHLYPHFRRIGGIEPGNGLDHIIRVDTHPAKHLTNGITEFCGVGPRRVQVETPPCG